MKRKTKYVLAAALLLPTLGGHPVFAAGKSAITVSGFKTDLQPFTLGGNGEGEAEDKLKTTPQGTNESFNAEAEFVIPDANLGITDLNTAPSAQFELHLSANNTDYAVCTMDIKEIEFEYKPTGVQTEAEYAVSVSQQTPTGGTPTLSQKVGSCLIAGGINGVPKVASGDVAKVFLVTNPPAGTPLLIGTFH
jgi:hypothetical protein